MRSLDGDVKNLKTLYNDQTANIAAVNNEVEKVSRVTGQLSLNVINLESKIEELTGIAEGELKEVIVDEDNYIIFADSQGRDYYNTRYASGIKTGLEPGSMYIRICTAVKNIDPIYIPLDPLIKNLPTGEGGNVNINEIVNEVLKSPIFDAKLENKVGSVIDDAILEVTAEVNKLDKHVSDLDNNVNFLASSISSFDDRIESTETQMEALQTNVEGYDNRISTAESKVLNIEESTEILTTKISDVEEDLKEQSNLIQTNASDIIMVKETTSTLTTTVNDFDERIVQIENVLNNTNDEGLNEEETDEFFK
jgi:chromosome segregation ATPase